MGHAGGRKERWKSVGDLDPKKAGLELRRDYDYIDAMAVLERGLTPGLFHSQMKMIKGAEGEGNRTGAVEQMRNIYGLNYTGKRRYGGWSNMAGPFWRCRIPRG
jgi:hypothetical protein